MSLISYPFAFPYWCVLEYASSRGGTGGTDSVSELVLANLGKNSKVLSMLHCFGIRTIHKS